MIGGVDDEKCINAIYDLSWLAPRGETNDEALYQRYLAMTSVNEANGWYGGTLLGDLDENSEIFRHYAVLVRVNTFVAMRSRYDSSKTIAEGILQSLDPTCVVGGQVLGKGWCSILIQVQVDPLEELIRPFDMFETIGDVVGISVAWPKHLVYNAEE